jgi:hypothetical protein
MKQELMEGEELHNEILVIVSGSSGQCEGVLDSVEKSPIDIKAVALHLNVLLRERPHTDAKMEEQKRTH